MSGVDFLKKLGTKVLLHSGFMRIYRTAFPNKNPLILMYHQVKKNEFEKQMKYLKTNYNIISLNDLVERINKKIDFQMNTVVITFDDGYLNNYTEALPILSKYNITATLFITTSLIDGKELAWWDKIKCLIENAEVSSFSFKFDNLILNFNLKTSKDKNDAADLLHKVLAKYNYKMRIKAIKNLTVILKSSFSDEYLDKFSFMNWEQIKEFSNCNNEIGSHTITHPFLSNISKEEIKKEVNKSKFCLEKKLRLKIKSFCYPSGNFDNDVKEMVKKSGYQCACSIKLGFINQKSDVYELKRVGININDNLGIFSVKMTRLWTSIRSFLLKNENET